MFVGGMTQYLSTVQGMLLEIETKIQKMINSLVWDSKKASINLNTMSAPAEEGRIGYLIYKLGMKPSRLCGLKNTQP